MFPDQFFLLIKMVVFIYRIRCNYSATNNNLALPFQLNNLVLMGVAPQYTVQCNHAELSQSATTVLVHGKEFGIEHQIYFPI